MMKPETIKQQQIIMTVLLPLIGGGFAVYYTLNPGPNDHYAMAVLHFHPIASLFGALLPAVISVPLVYWMFGRIFRRIAARYKVCEHCAETIKSDAKVCRYCGRDVERGELVSIAQLLTPSDVSNNQVWQTFLEHDPDVSEAVERLSSLSQRNVEEFRTLLLQHRDRTRVKEFEDEAIRRVQGPAFVGDTTFLQAYISLNREDGGLGDEFVRVVGVIGKPKDLERTVALVRKKFPAKGEAGIIVAQPAIVQQQPGQETFLEQKSEPTDAIIVAQPTPASDIPLNGEEEFASKQVDELIAADRARPPPLNRGAWVMWGVVGVIAVGAWVFLPALNGASTNSSSVHVTATERRHELQTGNLPLVESKLTGITNIDAADQLIATQLGFYRLPSHEADIVESEESWWWEPTKTGPNDFRMYIRNPSNTAIVGVLLKIHEGDCRSLKANPETSWDYFFLQFSSSLEADHAGVIRADMPFATHFQGCAVVTAVYAASQNTPQPQQSSTPFEDAAAAYGRGDYATALSLFRVLADQGNSASQTLLGIMYKEGQGVPQNDAEAVKWYRKAADKGFAGAQTNLGFMYRNGRGVPKNGAEAMKWSRLAADQGDATAQFNLGLIYRDGEGVPQNYAEALKWFRLAADQGNAYAQTNLGKMYSEGHGASQNYAEAFKWFLFAADQGNAKAQTNLGIMYVSGEGVPQNYVNAHMWFSLAAAQGNQDAVKNRDLIEQSMTPPQLTEAQKLAREWHSKKFTSPTAPAHPGQSFTSADIDRARAAVGLPPDPARQSGEPERK
jgi:TPR repeat protein